MAVSTFSKPLALLIGLLVLGNQVCYRLFLFSTISLLTESIFQFLESRGIHIIPYNKIQQYAKGIDVRSSLQDNVAFKLSLGTTFVLAAFAEF